MRQTAKQHEIVQIQIVAGVDAQAERVGQPCRVGIDLERSARFLRAPFEGARERLRVELDAIGARRGRQLDGLRDPGRRRG